MDPGADGADVALFQELRVRERYRDPGEVGFLLAGGERCGKRLEVASVGAALEVEGELRGEVERSAVPDLGRDRGMGDRAFGGVDARGHGSLLGTRRGDRKVRVFGVDE